MTETISDNGLLIEYSKHQRGFCLFSAVLSQLREQAQEEIRESLFEKQGSLYEAVRDLASTFGDARAIGGNSLRELPCFELGGEVLNSVD